MAQSHSGARRDVTGPGRLVAIVVAALAAVTGCAAHNTNGPHAATLSQDAVRDTYLRFLTNRAPVLAPGSECTAFTPRVHTIAGVPQDVRATPMVPGHGCWAGGTHGTVVSVMTTATPFGSFWRRDYPNDDGSGITATMVDKDAAQLFERFLIDNRYYAVGAASRWTAGLDSGTTKTVCMLVIDTGAPQPLLINLTQQVPHTDPTARTVTQQCATAVSVATAILGEQDPGGGSHMS
ncbi:hypothetical protein NONO_c38810 [Nocardia nova SH22a]|uniref:DUF3558 domain-containing protein n=1 Tax=Nocardia nova SH22a TaxID=1415166 RepID=W5TH18_9NOCA|nr:hypothetical protein [Nocardia nova]AHH18665.1 hypothetical protein NONO_c38810 [Nocardia nova SH22a]